jgi:RimJ/RimL family protein N-acetyltransferase
VAVTGRLNGFGQPIGPEVPGWTARPRPERRVLEGAVVRLEPIAPHRHAADLFDAVSSDSVGTSWTYLLNGPFADEGAFRAWLDAYCLGEERVFYAVVDRASGRAVAFAAYLRVDPANGSIEIGHIYFPPYLQRTRAATEALTLMIGHVMGDLGYRRCEWKCDALNGPSRAAAERLGFRDEGTFRQLQVYKGRSRDTAWFSIIDSEWPALKAAYAAWLDDGNFNREGRQRQRLSAITARARDIGAP